MKKYEELSKLIIENVGGKSNITGFVHCVTRLRFTLSDETLAKDEILKNTKGILSVIKSGGQYQIVIGNHVTDVYQEISNQLGSDQIELTEIGEANTKKGAGKIILDIVSNIFIPILPILCASGIIKGVNVLASFLGLYKKDSSFFLLFNAIGDTLFYFFPVFLGYTSAKKFGLKPLVGMGIGAMLCYPKINGVDMNFLGYAMKVSYTSTVLPVIVLCALAAPLEKFLDKRLPSVVKSFLSPIITFLIIITFGYIFIGPSVNFIAKGISSILQAFYNFNPVIAGFFVAAIWSVLVMFGVHAPFMMLLIMNIIGGTPEGLYAAISAQSFAITGTILGIWLKTKDKDLKSTSLGAWIPGVFGVTEPALYGILIPRIKYFVISCIASGIGGAYLSLMGIKAYQMAGMGVFRIPAFMEPGNVSYSMTHVIIGYAIALAAAGIPTYIMFKDKLSKNEI